jgi:hypothetical protein
MHGHFRRTMLRLLQKLLVPFLLVTAGMLATAGAATAHAGHGSNAPAIHHTSQHDIGGHTAVPVSNVTDVSTPAGAVASTLAVPCGNGHDQAPAMDAGCCAVTCHSAVGAPLAAALPALAILRIVPASIARTLHGSGTGGTERPPRLS